MVRLHGNIVHGESHLINRERRGVVICIEKSLSVSEPRFGITGSFFMVPCPFASAFTIVFRIGRDLYLLIY